MDHMEIDEFTGQIYRPMQIGMVGQVTPPPDMIGAARVSLSAQGFDTLMQQLNGRAPTPAELVALVEQERALGISPPQTN